MLKELTISVAAILIATYLIRKEKRMEETHIPPSQLVNMKPLTGDEIRQDMHKHAPPRPQYGYANM